MNNNKKKKERSSNAGPKKLPVLRLGTSLPCCHVAHLREFAHARENVACRDCPTIYFIIERKRRDAESDENNAERMKDDTNARRYGSSSLSLSLHHSLFRRSL